MQRSPVSKALFQAMRAAMPWLRGVLYRTTVVRRVLSSRRVKPSANAQCPCGSTFKLKKCCGVFHRGRPAAPLTLMRARYTAYAIGNVRFLMDTTHPEGPHARNDRRQWRADLTEHCRATTFEGLTIHSHNVGDDTARAKVTVTAHLSQAGGDVGFTERSLFLRDGARWKYHSGEMVQAPE